MKIKTDKRKETLAFEAVLGQLRHAYALLANDGDATWAPEQRKRLAEGLLGPQIAKLERLQVDFDQRGDDLLTALSAIARYRTRMTRMEESLLAKAQSLASASEARRIILSVFHAPEE